MAPDINSPQTSFRPRPTAPQSSESLPPTVPTPPRPTVGRTRSKKPFFMTVLAVILIAAAGYGGYAFEHNRAVSAENTQQAQITNLQKQVDSLQQQAAKSSTASTGAASTTTPAASGASTFKVSQLGVEIVNVPTSLADLTDSTITGNATGMYFSTSSLATADSGCSAAHGAIGALGRQSGTYSSSASATDAQFVKQFSGFWISYTHSQAACSTNATATSLQQSQAAAFQSLATTPANIQLIPS